MQHARVSLFLIGMYCVLTPPFLLGQDVNVKGLVTQRTADVLTVRTDDGDRNILLTDATKVHTPKGLGLRKEQMSWAELIPGLKVSVKAVLGADGKLTAKTISFSKQDLHSASMIQAGLAPTEARVSENKEGIAANKAKIEENEKEVAERFSALADYDVKNEVVVRFATGKSEISPADRMALSTMAAEASKLRGYIIEVKGFADSTGNAAANQTLSKDRAEAVVNYLLQECHVPPRHIVAPGAMGISNPAASNETSQGRAENRRVEAKVLVNKAIAADSQ